MYDLNFVWFLVWVTSIILFTAAVLVVVFLVVWVAVRKVWWAVVDRREQRRVKAAYEADLAAGYDGYEWQWLDKHKAEQRAKLTPEE